MLPRSGRNTGCAGRARACAAHRAGVRGGTAADGKDHYRLRFYALATPQPNNPSSAAAEKGALLHQLRIDRGLREEPPEVRRWPWLVGGALVLVLIGAGLWLMKSR